jgi:hypothetical protein
MHEKYLNSFSILDASFENKEKISYLNQNYKIALYHEFNLNHRDSIFLTFFEKVIYNIYVN